MKIECTKEEFKALLDLVYAGNLLINGMRSKEERIEAHAEMEQKIFAMANSFGIEDLVAYDEEYEEYMPTHTYENGEFTQYIDAYEDQVFWEELTLRMARRDALSILTDEDPEMAKSELNKLQLKLEDEYETEFSENGLYHLKVVKPEIKPID
ncbi:MAG: hypothetical protein ACRCW2_12125 [Cellulosilyticaceae bacterium]